MAENSSRLARAPSVSSAGTASTTGAHGVIPRYTPKPEPAYISASSAADHITHRHHHENNDLLSPTATPTNDGAEFSVSSLALLNSFLDSLLYNFLGKARSTELSKLRLAILEVLKAKLGREALASADEELEGLLGDADDDDSASESPVNGSNQPRRSSTPSLDWHLESAFKRMRLRVMVFIRLGDFDDDDEEKFLEEDASDTSPALDNSILSSPAAVYLASVLEYLAEQSLSLVGDAAYSRSKSKARRTLRDNLAVRMNDSENVVVEDIDVEKIALNPSLGRLWRTWRKNQRSIVVPTSPIADLARRTSVTSPTRSLEEMRRRSELRRSGSFQVMQTVDATQEDAQEEKVIPDCEPSETDIAANIPLPVSTRDVDEIEIPGVAKVIYDDDEEQSDDEDVSKESASRPRSVSFSVPGAFITSPSAEETPKLYAKPALTRQRSNSVPHAGGMPWDWIPASVRRTLAKFAAMDDVELASITPLPVDNDDDFADIDENGLVKDDSLAEPGVLAHDVNNEIDATAIKTETVRGAEEKETKDTSAGATENATIEDHEDKDSLIRDQEIATPKDALEATENDTSATTPVSIVKDATVKDGPKSNSSHANVGVVASASALIAATAAALAAASQTTSKQSSAKPESRSIQEAEDLSVQTKEVFEPGDNDSARPSMEFVPKSILKPARPPPAPRTVERKMSSDNVKMAARTKPEAVMPSRQIAGTPEEGEQSKSLVSVYSPTTTAKEAIGPVKSAKDDSAAAADATFVHQQTIDHDVQLQDAIASKASVVSASGSQVQSPLPKESKSESLSPVNVEQSTKDVPNTGVDSKMTSPMHIAELTRTPSDVINSNGSNSATSAPIKEPSMGFPERKESIAAAPAVTAPIKEVTANTPVQAPSAKDGPPKPLTSTGDRPINPYAMLYEDIEPEAIGVAKTSNVPIHSTTPSVSPDSRPWTPNRGAVRSPSSKENVNAEQRTRNLPSPLRVEKDQQASEQVLQETPKPAVSTDDYDLDKPIDPGRFQSWTKPKDSPTIPKFYNPVSTPTTAEAPRSGNSPQGVADHSPKGSQSSHKSTKRASEELKEREFDALLDRNETVKYTLTPEEIRDVGPYSPKTASGERKVPAPIDTAKKASIPGALSPTLLRKTPPATTTAHVQPPTTTVVPIVPVAVAAAPAPSPAPTPKAQIQAKPPPSSMRPLKISEIRKSISALSPEPTEPRKRRSGLMAREARVLGGDTKDFVDFIRSCAPTSDDQVQPAVLSNRWSAGPSMGTTRSAKSNMVPREPDHRNGPSGDLIDFLRDGPPGGPNGPVSPSNVTSVNTNKPLPDLKAASSPPPQAARKIHRNKDPYAIDYDDDDDDEFTALPVSGNQLAGVPPSENLQDFLRSTSPGPSRLNGVANGVNSSVRNGASGQRSASAASMRPSQASPVTQSSNGAGLSGQSLSANNTLNSREPPKASGGFFARKKFEARPAGATRGFGGHGFHYSTSDLADYLRSSGPNGAALNGNATNGAPTSNGATRESYNGGNTSGRNTPSGSIGLKRGDSTRRRMFGRKQEVQF